LRLPLKTCNCFKRSTSLSQTHTHTHIQTHLLYLSLSLTHTHTHFPPLLSFHTFFNTIISLILSLSVSISLPLSLSYTFLIPIFSFTFFPLPLSTRRLMKYSNLLRVFYTIPTPKTHQIPFLPPSLKFVWLFRSGFWFQSFKISFFQQKEWSLYGRWFNAFRKECHNKK